MWFQIFFRGRGQEKQKKITSKKKETLDFASFSQINKQKTYLRFF